MADRKFFVLAIAVSIVWGPLQLSLVAERADGPPFYPSPATIVAHVSGDTGGRDVSQLEILQPNYPRAFFFRASEQAWNPRRYPTYESWERNFDRLQGIIGKCLDEECVGRQQRNPEFFTRFKQRHPRQAVLLHFNGNSRDPRYEAETYFAGHWVYRPATMILEDVPAEDGESVIKVANARDFRVKMGRYKTSNDDLALFGVTAEGKHDWRAAEQVRLLAVDYQRNTIRVKRGCYGTRPRAFRAQASRAAAHQTEGPWGKNNNLLWFYNFATHCPRDIDGRTCADRLVDDLGAGSGREADWPLLTVWSLMSCSIKLAAIPTAMA